MSDAKRPGAIRGGRAASTKQDRITKTGRPPPSQAGANPIRAQLRGWLIFGFASRGVIGCVDESATLAIPTKWMLAFASLGAARMIGFQPALTAALTSRHENDS
jgi:hypothetical protein